MGMFYSSALRMETMDALSGGTLAID